MSETLRVACVQNNARTDMAANIAAACDLVRRARDAGADFITLPEHCTFMVPESERWRAEAAPLDDHPGLAAFAPLAREVEAWLLVGSLPVRAPDGRVYNCSLLLDDTGAVAARYNKIHMFDVDLPTGEVFRESNDFHPGGDACLADTPWGKLGMTVCYDLRFPQLYRGLAQAGAAMLSVPAAFTKVTGDAHWHTLLRARAIENTCFVIAPCQWGWHYGRRETCGHSLIIDPWGEVLADGGEENGVVTADIDIGRVAEVRAMIPSLRHDRPFSLPDGGRRSAAPSPAADRAARGPRRR